jgi:hypothetical protein
MSVLAVVPRCLDRARPRRFVVAAALMLSLASGCGSSREVAVPRVGGLEAGDAVRLLCARGLAPAIPREYWAAWGGSGWTAYMLGPRTPVLESDPPAGTRVAAGSLVRLLLEAPPGAPPLLDLRCDRG